MFFYPFNCWYLVPASFINGHEPAYQWSTVGTSLFRWSCMVLFVQWLWTPQPTFRSLVRAQPVRCRSHKNRFFICVLSHCELHMPRPFVAHIVTVFDHAEITWLPKVVWLLSQRLRRHCCEHCLPGSCNSFRTRVRKFACQCVTCQACPHPKPEDIRKTKHAGATTVMCNHGAQHATVIEKKGDKRRVIQQTVVNKAILTPS